jgi:hypothetical protein
MTTATEPGVAPITVAIDPGIRGCGVAIFRGQTLDRAAYVKNSALKGNLTAECVAMAKAVQRYVMPTYADRPDALVFEWPRTYLPGKQSGAQSDLLALAGVDAAIATALTEAGDRLAPVVTFHPEEWKGQLDKKVMNARVKGRLSEAERATITCKPASMLHNVLDSIGIGLKYLGRLERRRVYA